MARHLIACLIAIAMSTLCSYAQLGYSGRQNYDGEHKNEVSGYIVGGHNSVTGTFVGPSLFYTRHFTERWDLQGAADIPIGKSRYGVFARGSYCWPFKWFNVYIAGKVMYNRYQSFKTNEYASALTVSWESNYFRITIGQSLVSYNLLSTTYTEPLNPVLGLEANIRPRLHPWNIGLFIRNYDDFYFEHWNINWGINFNARLTSKLPMRLFGEFNLRPAGSLSQLANKYETSLKVGLKYGF
jgi:hypothetical protein